MMPLMKRRARATIDGQPIGGNEDGAKKSRDPRRALPGIFIAVAAMTAVVVFGRQVGDTSTDSTSLKVPGTAFEIESGVNVVVKFDEGGADATTVSLGPHRATLILQKYCEMPGLWIRVEGDALAPVVLHEGTTTTWDGSFTLPVEGNFSLVAYWYGCDGSSSLQTRKVLTNVIATATSMVDSSKQRLFPSSAWISSKKFTQAKAISQPYLLHNPQIPATSAKLFKTSESFVAVDSATFRESKFYQFSDLSNYELVCWIGSESAALLHASFRQLRPLVDGHQRPFKFHLYDSKSFNSPDESWEKDTKERFRKCKHILISMDEVKTPTTQTEYIEQVSIFITHLLKAFPDDTFPIWMFTVMESPTKPTNCLNPSLARSSDHSCNTALKELFQNSPFPERVRLLDSTEITLPQLGENPKDVATAIALRIFVFVGKQVAEWRAKGQVGGVKGLQRGDHLEPNFDLVAYTAWGQKLE